MRDSMAIYYYFYSLEALLRHGFVCSNVLLFSSLSIFLCLLYYVASVYELLLLKWLFIVSYVASCWFMLTAHPTRRHCRRRSWV